MNARDRRLLPLVLNAIGIAVVAYASVTSRFWHESGWSTVATLLALLTWGVVQVLQRREIGTERTRRVLTSVRRFAIVVGVVVASLSQVPSDGIHIAPLAILLIFAISDETEPVWFGIGLAMVSIALTPIGAIWAHAGTPALLGFLAATAVWILIGISRRQARTAQRRTRELLEQQHEARDQEARAALLAERQAAARDIHDVLAHSLGGLVIQLDAAEALLESGRVADAQAKVAGARTLAADGLADARRAVAALRSPSETDVSETAPSDLAGAAERLLRAHRELGGTVDAHVDLAALDDLGAPLPPAIATAFERALQEALSNARRHAPDEEVTMSLTASPGALDLEVHNPLPLGQARSRVGGGHGLTGMKERFAALPGGIVTTGVRGNRFVVSATASIAED